MEILKSEVIVALSEKQLFEVSQHVFGDLRNDFEFQLKHNIIDNIDEFMEQEQASFEFVYRISEVLGLTWQYKAFVDNLYALLTNFCANKKERDGVNEKSNK